MKLFSETLGGNLHEATATINRICPEIIPGIVTMSCDSPYSYTIVVYRAEQQHKAFVRKPPRRVERGQPE